MVRSGNAENRAVRAGKCQQNWPVFQRKTLVAFDLVQPLVARELQLHRESEANRIASNPAAVECYIASRRARYRGILIDVNRNRRCSPAGNPDAQLGLNRTRRSYSQSYIRMIRKVTRDTNSYIRSGLRPLNRGRLE